MNSKYNKQSYIIKRNLTNLNLKSNHPNLMGVIIHKRRASKGRNLQRCGLNPYDRLH